MHDDTPMGSPRQSEGSPSRTDLEAAAFRRLVSHLRARTDVQNIDLMTLAGFCRNCLANWYADAAAEAGTPVSKDAARELIYGMPYDTWKEKHQPAATPDQVTRLAKAGPETHR